MGFKFFMFCALCSAANGALLLRVNPHRTVNRILCVGCIWSALWCVCVAFTIREGAVRNVVQVLYWLRANSVIAAFAPFFIWATATALANKGQTLRRTLPKTWPAFAIGCCLAASALWPNFIDIIREDVATGGLTLKGPGYPLYQSVLIGSSLVILVRSLRSSYELHGFPQMELRVFIVSITSAFILAVSSAWLGQALEIPWIRRLSAVWFLAYHATTVWTLCSYKEFNAKRILVSILQRCILVSVIGVISTAAILVLPGETGLLNLLGMTSVSAILAILADSPMRRWLGIGTRSYLGIPRKKILGWGQTFRDRDILKREFEKLLQECCHTDSILFFVRDGSRFESEHTTISAEWIGFAPLEACGWSTQELLRSKTKMPGKVECLQFMALNSIGAMLSVPRGTGTPSLIVALGQKRTFQPYTEDECEGLLDLAELMNSILLNSMVANHRVQLENAESISMMARGLAHDLNNLTTPVATFLDHIEPQVPRHTQAAIVLADAKHSLATIQDYVRESHFLSRPLKPTYETIDAAQLVQSAIRVAQPHGRSRSISISSIVDQSFVFAGDFALLQRLLQNLLFNAVDASASGQEVILGTLFNDNGHVGFTVTDRGHGIPAKFLNKVFDPYFTTKSLRSQGQNAGLGLAICRKIVEIHGGTIEVSSKENDGTTFRVLIPVGKPQPFPMKSTKPSPPLLDGLNSLAC